MQFARRRGPRPLPPHPRRRPGGLRRRGRRRRLRPVASRRCTRTASATSPSSDGVTVDPGALGDDPRRRVPPGPLRRGADRRRQALRPGAARRGGLRAEGLPAAHPDPPDGGRPLPAGSRSSAPRRSASPTASRCPAATATSTPTQRAGRGGAQPGAAGGAGAGGVRRPCRALGRDVACSRPSRAVELDYLALTSPDLGEPPGDRRGPDPGRRPGRHHPADRQHADRLRRSVPPAGTALAGSTTSAWKKEQLMLRTMMKSKIHRATVTQADLHYVGSVTVDEDLLDAADLLAGELVHIVDVTNGARLETYTIAGERGSGVIGINGAAARLVHPGDTVILIAYAPDGDAEARELKPYVVFVDADNKVHGHRLRPGRDVRRRVADPRRRRRSLACPDEPDHRAGPAAASGPRPPGWTTRADVVVVGSGIAGLTAALRIHAADPSLHLLVVTKDVLSGRARPSGPRAGSRRRSAPATPPSSTSATPSSPGRAPATSTPSGSLVTEGPDAVRELIALGTQFDHHPDGELSLTREGGHHRDRIAHAGGDATGAEIQRALIAAVERAPAIEVVQHALAVDLLRAADGGRRRADAARARRGPARRRRGRALPGGRPRLGRPRPGLQPVHQPQRLHRRRDGRRAARRRPAARPRVRPVPPDRDVARPRLPGPAAADLRGGARRGRLPRRLRGQRASCRASTSSPTSPRATWSPRRSPAG